MAVEIAGEVSGVVCNEVVPAAEQAAHAIYKRVLADAFGALESQGNKWALPWPLDHLGEVAHEPMMQRLLAAADVLQRMLHEHVEPSPGIGAGGVIGDGLDREAAPQVEIAM